MVQAAVGLSMGPLFLAAGAVAAVRLARVAQARLPVRLRPLQGQELEAAVEVVQGVTAVLPVNLALLVPLVTITVQAVQVVLLALLW